MERNGKYLPACQWAVLASEYEVSLFRSMQTWLCMFIVRFRNPTSTQYYEPSSRAGLLQVLQIHRRCAVGRSVPLCNFYSSLAYIICIYALRTTLLFLLPAAVRRTVTFQLPDEDSASSSEPTYDRCVNTASLVGDICGVYFAGIKLTGTNIHTPIGTAVDVSNRH